MTDRELLELAAKAAGIEVIRWQDDGSAVYRNDNGALISWHPLAPWGDGDALRLVVKLQLSVHCNRDECCVTEGHTDVLSHDEPYGDPYASARRAVVRAAAEIGRWKQ